MQPVEFLPNWLAQILFWIYYNQTLIAGGAATLAAIATIKQLQKQGEKNECDRARNHSRRHRMLRAGLPPALADITEYTEKCMGAFLSYLKQGGTIEMPPLPSAAYRDVQAVVETADDPVAQDLERLLIFAQIQHARVRNIFEDEPEGRPEDALAELTEHQSQKIYSLIAEVLFLHNSVSRLYDYARGKRNEAKCWRDTYEVDNLLLTFTHPEGGYVVAGEPLNEYVKRRWPGLVRDYGSPKDLQ